jgi:hypothetical protein
MKATIIDRAVLLLIAFSACTWAQWQAVFFDSFDGTEIDDSLVRNDVMLTASCLFVEV